VVVGTLELHLRLEGCFSLKDKRQVLRALQDRARRHFHVSIAETADQDLWNVATIGVACVSNDASHIESILNKLVEAIESNPAVSIEQAIRDIERK
jgi:uncharacterized protein YlxP (DUF503 family)